MEQFFYVFSLQKRNLPEEGLFEIKKIQKLLLHNQSMIFFPCLHVVVSFVLFCPFVDHRRREKIEKSSSLHQTKIENEEIQRMDLF